MTGSASSSARRSVWPPSDGETPARAGPTPARCGEPPCTRSSDSICAEPGVAVWAKLLPRLVRRRITSDGVVRGFAGEVTFGDFAQQGLVAHLEDPGGLDPVPVDAVEDFPEGLPLCLSGGAARDRAQSAGEVGRRRRRRRRWRDDGVWVSAGSESGLELLMTPLGIAEHDEAMDEVFELAHVARPRTGRDQGERFRQELPTLTVLAVEPLKEYGGQDWDLLPPFAEGRHVDLHDVQAIVEILAELAAAQGELQVSIGRGHDPGVDHDGLAAADSRKLQVLHDVQQFRLEGEGEFADLVQVDGSAVRQLEHPQLSPGGPGEGAFFVAKERGFQEPSGEGGTVHPDERPVRPRGRRVDGARHEVLADPALPAEEDGRIDH